MLELTSEKSASDHQYMSSWQQYLLVQKYYPRGLRRNRYFLHFQPRVVQLSFVRFERYSYWTASPLVFWNPPLN